MWRCRASHRNTGQRLISADIKRKDVCNIVRSDGDVSCAAHMEEKSLIAGKHKACFFFCLFFFRPGNVGSLSVSKLLSIVVTILTEVDILEKGI